MVGRVVGWVGAGCVSVGGWVGSPPVGEVPVGRVGSGAEVAPPGLIRFGSVSPSGAITLFSSSTREMVASEKKAVASQGLEV